MSDENKPTTLQSSLETAQSQPITENVDSSTLPQENTSDSQAGPKPLPRFATQTFSMGQNMDMGALRKGVQDLFTHTHWQQDIQDSLALLQQSYVSAKAEGDVNGPFHQQFNLYAKNIHENLSWGLLLADKGVDSNCQVAIDSIQNQYQDLNGVALPKSQFETMQETPQGCRALESMRKATPYISVFARLFQFIEKILGLKNLFTTVANPANPANSENTLPSAENIPSPESAQVVNPSATAARLVDKNKGAQVVATNGGMGK